MNRSKKSPNKVRITLDLSPEFYRRLGKLEDTVDAESKSQVIREALRLYEYIVHRYSEGDEFIFRTKDGDEKSVFLLGSPSPSLD